MFGFKSGIAVKPVDIETIRRPIQAFTIVIVAIEALLGFELYRASASWERLSTIFAMLLLFAMAFTLLYFLIGAAEKSPEDQAGTKIVSEETLQSIDAGATEDQIKSPAPEELGASDGSYKINKPPSNWKLQELAYNDYARRKAERAGGKGSPFSMFFEAMISHSISSQGKVLIFTCNNSLTIFPHPGKTLEDNRLAVAAFWREFETELAIIPLHRFGPPTYKERTFFSNIIQNIAAYAQMWNFDVLDVRRKTAGGPARFLVSGVNSLRNLQIVGRNETGVDEICRIIGIEGEVNDYLLFTTDYSVVDGDGNRSENNEKIVDQLIESFRFLRRPAEDELREGYQKSADREYMKSQERNKEAIFHLNLTTASAKMQELDLKSVPDLETALRQLRSLAEFADYMDIKSDIVRTIQDGVAKGSEGDLARVRLSVFQLRKFARMLPRALVS